MRLPWDQRGTVHLHRLPNKSPASLRRLSDEHLNEFIAGWKPGTADWIAGNAELQRRHNGLARWAFAVSVLSLTVAIIALFVKT